MATGAHAQGAAPLFFETGPTTAAFTISFTESRFRADEVWYVTGGCSKMDNPAPVYLTPLALDADTTVYLTRYPYDADAAVCIVNPDDAPQGFWDAYERVR